MNKGERIEEALGIAVRFGGIDGDHHKAWVIDQIVRALCGCKVGADGTREPTAEYLKLVAEAKDGEDGPDTYGWDEGTPP